MSGPLVATWHLLTPEYPPDALKAEAKLRSDEVKYIESLLSEYARSFRSRLNFIEEPRYLAVLEAVEAVRGRG